MSTSGSTNTSTSTSARDERSRPQRSRRGFASLPDWRRREIASLGGYAAHRWGTAHEWTSAEAREAGRKGGRATKARKGGGA